MNFFRHGSLKRDWMELPDEYFKTSIFGELSIGQQFIFFPVPGDNCGHGGLKNIHSIFLKTGHKVVAAPELGFSPRRGRAVMIGTGVEMEYEDFMPVILVR